MVHPVLRTNKMFKIGAGKQATRVFLIVWALFSGTLASEWRDVFNPFQVLTLHLEMDPADWDRVRFDQPSQSEGWIPQVAEAWFHADGETPIRVTVRRKGESDEALPSDGDPQKVSLKIDINDPLPGQKWRGLTKLSLENGGSDPLTEGFAWMAHWLATDMYGYEAAHAAWVKVYINGDFKGVFINAEQRNAQFLRNHDYYKEGGTWLYKVDGSASLEVGVGHSPAYQHLCFSPFNAGPGGGGGGGGGCPQPDLEADLPLWINLRGFFTLAAVDAFVENRDALFSHSGKNSFAVDFDPPFPRTRLYFPWDLDTTISDGNMSIYGNEAYQQILLSHPWFGQVYEQILRDLTSGPFSVAALHGFLEQLEQVVGPAYDSDPYVYSGGSAGAFDNMRDWVTRRVANVRAQLIRPYIEAPLFNQDGGEVVAGFKLIMTASAGSVYYTVDGSDPRAPGGAIAPGAILYNGPLVIERTTQVNARSFDGSLWSALPKTATFNIARYASPIRITEIMYHPLGDAAAGEDEYEFIELKNTGTAPVDLSGFYFDGINFVFPAQTVVQPGAFVVLARNPTAFALRYPDVSHQGVYWSKLADGGEKIRLLNSDGNTIISIDYKDTPPWPISPDGFGHSLVLLDPAADPDDPEAWRASSALHGSPGQDDPAPPYGVGIVINEVLAHTDPPYEDAIELYNPTGQSIDISGWFLSDDLNRTNTVTGYDLKKYRIPLGTILPANGYKVFYQSEFSASNPDAPFALSEFGETVYLSSADANGNLTGAIIGAEFMAVESNISIGRHRTSTGVDFVPLAEPTFGLGNPTSLAQFRSGAGAPNSPPKVGPVVINEIMYNPPLGGNEFIELLNISSEPVDISGWNLAGTSYLFPGGTVLEANGVLLLLNTNLITAADFRAAYDVPPAVSILSHTFVLENEGEALRLEKPNTAPLDPFLFIERVRYNDKAPWPAEADGEGPALERYAAAEYGNDPINWRTVGNGGSPGRLNQFPVGLAIARGSSWKYHAAGSNLGAAWRDLDYSDSSWPRGDGLLGYGSDEITTFIPFGSDPNAKPITTYFRKEFVVNDPPSQVQDLTLLANYDDGFVLYLNGQEIFRSASIPGGTINWDTPAASSYQSLGYESIDLSAHTTLLHSGRNLLAVEVHQDSPDGADLAWDASLTYQLSTSPTVPALLITPSGGQFAEPVTVSITVPLEGAEIFYTMDGTEPDSSSLPYFSPFLVTSSAILKARAYKPGYNQSPVAIATFSFTSPNSDTDGDGLPDTWEETHFGTPTAADPAADQDGDTLSNHQEFLAGTDPNDPVSSLRITRISGDGQLQAGLTIEWTSAPNVVYQLEASTSLANPFEPLASGLIATPPLNSFSLPQGTNPAFYRVRVQVE